MKVMKRAMLLLLAAVLGTAVFAFAGCAKGDEGDTDEIKVVRMWLHKSEAEDEGMVYSALADSFNEEHFKTQDGRDIQVRLEFKSDASTLATAIAAEVLTGGLPDVVAVDAPNVAAYANDGILTDISDYISQEVLDDYVDSVIEQGTIGGGYTLSPQWTRRRGCIITKTCWRGSATKKPITAPSKTRGRGKTCVPRRKSSKRRICRTR